MFYCFDKIANVMEKVFVCAVLWTTIIFTFLISRSSLQPLWQPWICVKKYNSTFIMEITNKSAGDNRLLLKSIFKYKYRMFQKPVTNQAYTFLNETACIKHIWTELSLDILAGYTVVLSYTRYFKRCSNFCVKIIVK